MNLFLPSVANFKCTPFDRQMYPQGYMYPSLGTPALDNQSGSLSTRSDTSRFESVDSDKE